MDLENKIGGKSKTRGREPPFSRLLQYQFRINARECSHSIDRQEEILWHLKKIGIDNITSLIDLPNIPDVSKLLLSPWSRFCLEQIQNCYWAIKALRRKFQPTERPIVNDVSPVVSRPSVPSDTRRGKLYIDMTSSHRGTIGGGIKRVCLAIAKELQGSSLAHTVVTVSGKLYNFDLESGIGQPITLTRNDTYLIFDTFWEPFEEYRSNLYVAREKGARTIVCVYDAIPVIYPGLVGKSWACLFERQIKMMLPATDLILTISDASARQIRSAFRRFTPSVPVRFFHLGADSLALDASPTKNPTPTSCFRFVSVGTIEPKKGYDVAIDAFEQIWAEGIDVAYTICGRPGWMCGALIRRIEDHKEYNRRLFWLSDASDDELSAELAGSDCYIQASVAEGFGLPLVEASRAGLPLIASDLPVFREIAGDAPKYFVSCDSRSLAAAVRSTVRNPVRPSTIEPITWSASARELLDVLQIAEP